MLFWLSRQGQNHVTHDIHWCIFSPITAVKPQWKSNCDVSIHKTSQDCTLDMLFVFPSRRYQMGWPPNLAGVRNGHPHLQSVWCRHQMEIHTWAKVLHIFKEAKFLGNLCENYSNYLYQHITRVFYCISAKVLLLGFIAHWQIDDDPWQCGTDLKVSLPVAFGRNLELDTTRLFFHINCQYSTEKAPNHQQWCIVANYWT